eukprot:jgi/Ulvmu1/4504/UM002_0230.1
MKPPPTALRACTGLDEKARFLKAFVQKQNGRQQEKARESAWLEDERTLRERWHTLEGSLQEQLDNMTSWLPADVAAELRQQTKETHQNQVELRMLQANTVAQFRAMDPSARAAASLGRQELQAAADLGRQVQSLQHEIKRLHWSITAADELIPNWWKEFERQSAAGAQSAALHTPSECESTCNIYRNTMHARQADAH